MLTCTYTMKINRIRPVLSHPWRSYLKSLIDGQRNCVWHSVGSLYVSVCVPVQIQKCLCMWLRAVLCVFYLIDAFRAYVGEIITVNCHRNCFLCVTQLQWLWHETFGPEKSQTFDCMRNTVHRPQIKITIASNISCFGSRNICHSPLSSCKPTSFLLAINNIEDAGRSLLNWMVFPLALCKVNVSCRSFWT